MNEKTQTVSRQDATYVAPIVPQFADLKEAFLAEAYKPYFKALQAAADTHQLVQVPIPETFRIEKGNPTVDYVTIDVRGTGSPMRNVNPEFVLLTVGSGAGLRLIDKVTGLTYNVLGKTGRQIAKSMLAGEASNQVLEGINGKTYGENLRSAANLIVPKVISENTPEIIKSVTSEGLNPFYYGFQHNSPFLEQLIRHTTGPHKAGIIPTARLAYHLNFDKPVFNTEPLLNVGWAPKQTIPVSHLAEAPISQFRLFNPDRWGYLTEGQNPFGIWFSPQQNVGIPRMKPSKRLKAARARAKFQTRPWRIEGDLSLEKPIVTIGEVPNRSALEYAAERSGADGIIFNNIYDNGFDATTSIKSFQQPNIARIIERPRVDYFGPTMGKTTFVKGNPELPFDDMDVLSKEILWNKRVELATKLGLNPREFATNRVPEEIANTPQYKQALEEYLATILDFVSDYVVNPANKGRTLLTSNRHVLDSKNKVFISNTPVVPDFNTFLQRNQQRGFRETPEQALEWWNSIINQPSVQVDNRYMSDILNSPLQQSFGSTYDVGKGNKLVNRVQSLRALNFLKSVYSTPAYRERVKAAYPTWADEYVDNFIQNQVNRVDLAISRLSVGKNANELGNTGRTVIQNTSTAQEPVSIDVAYDANDPFLVALHEGLHFSSLGGLAPRGYFQDPDAFAIYSHNNRILPTLKRSFYKKFTESSNPEQVKEEYLTEMQGYYPYLTREQLEEFFYNRIIKEGPYYNADDELRSFGMAELLQGYYKGEIKNINDVKEVYQWLINKYNNNELSAKLRRILEGYRPNFYEWAKYLTQALSISPIILKKRETNERMGNTTVD